MSFRVVIDCASFGADVRVRVSRCVCACRACGCCMCVLRQYFGFCGHPAERGSYAYHLVSLFERDTYAPRTNNTFCARGARFVSLCVVCGVFGGGAGRAKKCHVACRLASASTISPCVAKMMALPGPSRATLAPIHGREHSRPRRAPALPCPREARGSPAPRAAPPPPRQGCGPEARRPQQPADAT